MVTTVTVAAPLLVLQSLPAFLAERDIGSPLAVISLVLAALQCLAFPAALWRRTWPARLWLRLSVIPFLGLVALERAEIGPELPAGFVPWLVPLACVAFGAVALGVRQPLPASIGCGLVVVAFLAAYAGRMDAGQLVMLELGNAALAAALVLGVRSLRRRADRADLAERAAAERFESSRRFLAFEDERIRTDALLHDSVLNALLVASSGLDDPERTRLLAQNALAAISDTHGGPDDRSSSLTFGQAVAAVGDEFAPMRELVRLELAAADGVRLPEPVADTLIAAMLQALGNSIKHAGPAAERVVRAIPLPGGGIRISICDDGQGFDPTVMGPERLGVRVSIVERVRRAGGSAEIRSAPGNGTTVVLDWTPSTDSDPGPRTAALP